MFRAVLAAVAAALVVDAYQADPDGNPAPASDRLDGVTVYLARIGNLSRFCGPCRKVRR